MEEMMAWSKAIARPVLRVAQDLRAASHEAPWPGLRNSSSGGTCYSSGYCSWGEALRKMLWKWVWLSYGAPFLTQITVWFWYDDDMMFECNWSILKCISSHEDFGWRRIDCSGKLSLLAQFALKNVPIESPNGTKNWRNWSSGWSKGFNCAKDFWELLRISYPPSQARCTAERHLWLLGPAAGICLVNEARI